MKKKRLTPLGIEIKKKLAELGISQKQLAKAIGVSEVYLSMVIHGERSGKKYMQRIHGILGLVQYEDF